ncbi:MAG: ABC transporter permease, partial [Lachnospiraceae bacterium]|nr:ABC transporter permease [Lachnospiraceae bacterium]
EYQSGTLVLSLTKGLKRHNVVIAKTVVLVLLWTVCFWMCFGITYVYNDFYWDNSIADNLMFSSFCWWFFGIWVIMIMVLSSTLAQNGSGVLLGTGGVVFAIYLISMIPKVDKYMETMLTTGYSLTTEASKTSDYTVAVIVTLIVSVVFFVTGIIVFNKKRL